MVTPHQVLFGDVRHNKKNTSDTQSSLQPASGAETAADTQGKNDTTPVDQKMYSTPKPMAADTLAQRRAKKANEQFVKKNVNHLEPENIPDNRPIIESSDGSIRKFFTPEESAHGQIQTEEEVQKEKLEEVIQDSQELLFKCSTVFPFDLFPNSLIVDANHVNIVFREFFGSERRQSIDVKDITDVYAETSPFLAKLTIVDEGFNEETIELRNLWKNDALRARRIIQGLVTVRRQDIDLTKIEDHGLVEKLEEIGGIKD